MVILSLSCHAYSIFKFCVSCKFYYSELKACVRTYGKLPYPYFLSSFWRCRLRWRMNTFRTSTIKSSTMESLQPGKYEGHHPGPGVNCTPSPFKGVLLKLKITFWCNQIGTVTTARPSWIAIINMAWTHFWFWYSLTIWRKDILD